MLSTVTIENGTIKIPVEMVESDGLVILTLVQNAYLILRANELANYSPEKLAQLRQNAIALTQATEPTYKYHPTKVRALREMRALGIPVSGGEEYFPKPIGNPPPIEQVRQELASIKGNLSALVIAEREER